MGKVSLQDRLRGAIWGQFVGDAAGLGTSFISVETKLERRLPQDIPAGKTTGDQTHYGDTALLLLDSISTRQGFSARDFGARFVETFASPDYPNYIDKCALGTIENYHVSLEEGHPDLGYEFQGGADNDDIDTATWLAPLIAFYWDDPHLNSIVDKATRVTQNNELAVAYMRRHAQITRRLFNGEKLKEAFRKEAQSTEADTPIDRHVRSKIRIALDLESQDGEKVALELGTQSALDQSFPGAVYAAISHDSSFSEAVLHTLRAGGDSAGRAALVGVWMGAHLGIQAIPEKWRQRLNQYAEIERLTESLLSIKTHSL